MSLIARVTALAQAIAADVKALYAGKVEKVTGKGLSTEDYTTTEKNKLGAIAPGATANSTDAALLARANHTGTQPISTVASLQTSLDAKLATALRGAVSGVASLDAAGKIPVSQLPTLAVNEVFTVASQAAMLALTAERGDIAIRSDLGGASFVLAADAPGTLANWITLAQALSLALNALNSLTPAADRLAYFDSSSTAQLAILTAQARTLLAAADQAAQRNVLGLIPQTTQADRTVGSLMLAGAFGLGRIQDFRVSPNIVTGANIPSDFYSTGTQFGFIAGGVVTGGLQIAELGATNSFGVLTIHGQWSLATGAGGVQQVFSNGVREFKRAQLTASTWTTWQETATVSALDLKAPLATPTFTGLLSVGGTDSPMQMTGGLGATFRHVKTTAGGQIDIDDIPFSNTDQSFFRFHRNITTSGAVQVVFNRGNGTTASDHIFASAGTNAATTSSAILAAGGGKVAIGQPTVDAAAALAVNGAALIAGNLGLPAYGTSTNNTLAVEKNRGTAAAPTAALNNDKIGAFAFQSRDSGGTVYPNVVLEAFTTEDQTSTNRGALFQFATVKTGEATRSVAMQINGAGQISMPNGFLSGAPGRLGQYTLTTLPNAATYNGFMIDVTNATGGPKTCRSNGSVWQIINTTTTVI